MATEREIGKIFIIYYCMEHRSSLLLYITGDCLFSYGDIMLRRPEEDATRASDPDKGPQCTLAAVGPHYMGLRWVR